MSSALARLGQSGERLASDYLTRRGHRVLATNVRRREGEIDLVTVDGETLVFVEVKLRRPSALGGAVEALSAAKLRRLGALAAAYAAEHPELPAQLRVDLVAIDLEADGSLAGIRHVESVTEE
ncbi:MAG: YraN family protein [Dehalococcoidia bacterium]|nr:YraN family protein [Dehalococcoidia bacterium]